MTFTLDGNQITKEAAYDRIMELMPNGGTQFLDNAIAVGVEHGTERLTIHVGTKSTLVIEF